MHSSSSHRFDEPDKSNGQSEAPSHGNYHSGLLHPSVSMSQSQTLYVPIESPPTPAPSPGPANSNYHPYQMQQLSQVPAIHPSAGLNMYQDPALRRQFLSSILASCTSSELLFVSQTIAPLLKRDLLFSLPVELALHVLSFIDEPKTLTRAAQVSWHWYWILRDESIWKRLCYLYGFDDWDEVELEKQMGRERKRQGKRRELQVDEEGEASEKDEPTSEWPQPLSKGEGGPQIHFSPPTDSSPNSSPTRRRPPESRFSFRRHFKTSYIVRMNWRQGGKLLHTHRLPIVSPDSGTVTSLALDSDWVVVGLANSKIKVFSAQTGVLSRTLMGHELGVWGVCLVSRGGYRLPEKPAWKEGRRKTSVPARTTSEDGRSTTEGSSTVDTTSTTREARSFRKSRKIPREPDLHSLRTGIAGLAFDSGSDGNGTHVMPSDSLEHVISPAMRFALGLEPLDDTDGSSTSGDRVFDEDAAEREGQRQKQKRQEQEDQDGDGLGKPSNMCFSSQGWGQPNSIIVSGGCDKVLRVWNAKSGQCIYVLHGHRSTIRSIRVLHNRPIAVTGSRDATLRVWDVQRGRCLRVLEGHHQSVRCLDVCGNKVASGSYDATCRLWNIDTGQCLHVLQGHFHQIYSIAFDGLRIASGGLDTTVRVWDAETGQCIALLQGHTALVCQVQLSPTMLVTGGSDGRVITFSLQTYTALHRIAAHDSSVTSLQFDREFLVTGGNDGRVRLFETRSGGYIRDLSEPSESVWKVAFVRDTCAIMCKRGGKTAVEIWSLRPRRNGTSAGKSSQMATAAEATMDGRD